MGNETGDPVSFFFQVLTPQFPGSPVFGEGRYIRKERERKTKTPLSIYIYKFIWGIIYI